MVKYWGIIIVAVFIASMVGLLAFSTYCLVRYL